MIITTDKKGNQSLRMSRFEQTSLAAINIKKIGIQNLRAQGATEKEIIDAGIELAGLQRKFEEMISNESQ